MGYLFTDIPRVRKQCVGQDTSEGSHRAHRYCLKGFGHGGNATPIDHRAPMHAASEMAKEVGDDLIPGEIGMSGATQRTSGTSTYPSRQSHL
jgi:hypothetical protein